VAPAQGARAAAWCSVAMVAIAFVWFWPALGFGLRSDDYLLAYYTDRETGAVRWGRVLEEFVRPWFGAADLYRPLVSVSFGVELAAWPSLPARHAWNVACLGIAAAATAATAALLAPRRAPLAALLAGAVVVLHPAAVEPATWICARTTGMQVAAGCVAAWLFVRHRVRGGAAWTGVAAAAAALLCKEGASTLPLTLLVLDALRDPAAPWRSRLRALLPYAVLLLGYFVLRMLVLGQLGGGDGAGSALDGVRNVAARALQLVAPPSAPAPHGPTSAVAIGAPLAVALLIAGALLPLFLRLRIALLLVPVWLLLLLAPTHSLSAGGSFFGRLVLDAVPALAIALALSLAGANARALLWGASALQLLLLGSLAASSAGWLRQTAHEDRVARAVEHTLHAAAAGATRARPLAVTGLPYLPLFHQKLWGALGLHPFAPHDLAVIGMPELLVPDVHAPRFFKDAAPIHAIHAAGGVVAMLDGDAMRFVALPRAQPDRGALDANERSPRELLVRQPWPGTGVAALELELPAPAHDVRVRLLDDVPGQLDLGYGWQQIGAVQRTAWLDTTHAFAPVMLQRLLGQPFRGVELVVDGGDPPPGTRVHVHATLDERPLPAPAGGAWRTRAQLHELTSAPPANEPLRLYLLLPTGVRHQDVPAGGAVMDELLREHLRYALDLYAPLHVHWFWQTQPVPAVRPWRSALDHARAR
jgi:hypothetical protein